jgi:peptidoglycan/LPS O-acetylase OafA/YrhL
MPANVAFKPLATEFIGGNPNPLLRWFLVELYWVLRCLPYIMVAMLLTHPTVNQRCFKLIRKYSLLCLLVFLVFNTFGFLVLPQGVFEVTIGYSALVAAIAVSEHLRDSTLIRSLGQCSFGIYLIHLLFVEIFQSVFIRLYPNYVYDTSVVILLLSSLVVFLTSWGIVNLLIKQKRLSQILFGS